MYSKLPNYIAAAQGFTGSMLESHIEIGGLV